VATTCVLRSVGNPPAILLIGYLHLGFINIVVNRLLARIIIQHMCSILIAYIAIPQFTMCI